MGEVAPLRQQQIRGAEVTVSLRATGENQFMCRSGGEEALKGAAQEAEQIEKKEKRQHEKKYHDDDGGRRMNGGHPSEPNGEKIFAKT